MNKLSSLAKTGIAHKCFGNPIPQQAYDLIDAVEEAVPQFNPYMDVGDKLRALMGYIQNGSDVTIKLFQDDATNTFHVEAVSMGKVLWSEWDQCFLTVINKAYEKHAEKF